MEPKSAIIIVLSAALVYKNVTIRKQAQQIKKLEKLSDFLATKLDDANIEITAVDITNLNSI